MAAVTRVAAFGALAVFLLLGGLAAFAGAGDDERVAAACGVKEPVAELELGRPYAAASPFNQPIPAGAAVDAGSDRMIEGFVEAAEAKGFLVAVRQFTVPVYAADRRTPRYHVRLTAEWAPRRVLRNVPIPDEARPDPASDGHLTILDRSTGTEYDFWQARKAGCTWSASWGSRIRLSGRGIYGDGLAARASGFGLLAGLIRPDELRAGSIDHALVFSYPYTRANRFVPPATATDGRTPGPAAIPIGARLQLDPELDLDTLELAPYERVVAEALQRYGMYLGDSGGAVSLYALHPQSSPGSPWEDLLPHEDFVYLERIPLERFRVLELPPLRAR